MAVGRRTVLASGIALAAASSWSQTEPPVRLIVPFTPGTGMDMVARQVAPHLSERLRRPVVVDNRPGASGNIGTEAVVRAPADGSTLLVTANTVVMSTALYPNLTFDPVRDLDPVTLTSWGTLLLVAGKAAGINTVQELLVKARARPGALNYGSPGAGTPHHLAMELVKNRTGTFITHIPYRGTGPALTDLLGGQVQLMFLPIHVALQHVQNGNLKALGISSEKPSPLLPNVPPLRDLKLGDLDVEMWYGVLAPKGTPAPFVERLNRELKDILSRPDVKAAFETQGMLPTHNTPDAFRRMVAADAKRWSDLIKAQNIKAE